MPRSPIAHVTSIVCLGPALAWSSAVMAIEPTPTPTSVYANVVPPSPTTPSPAPPKIERLPPVIDVPVLSPVHQATYAQQQTPTPTNAPTTPVAPSNPKVTNTNINTESGAQASSSANPFALSKIKSPFAPPDPQFIPPKTAVRPWYKRIVRR